MASQSDIQSLVQQLTGVHTAGQQSVPSGVNNGNPNTIFNVTNPSRVPTVWDFAYTNPMDPRPIWNGITTTITPPTTVITDPNSGGGGGGGGGGTGGPLPNGGSGGGVGNTNLTNIGNTINANRINDALSRASAVQGLRYNGTTFTNQDGSGLSMPQWQQLIDMGLDVLGIGGNWFLSGSGNWDASNILASLLGSITGLPVNSIMTMIGKYGAQRGWSENNPFVDHYMDNVQNEIDSFSKDLNKKIGSQINDIGQRNINNTLSFIANNNLQGTSITNPSSLSNGDWSNLLSGTSVEGLGFGPVAFSGLGGAGSGTTDGGTGNLASGGIFGGGSGNFGPTSRGPTRIGNNGGISSILQNTGYYGAITDPDAIAAFMESLRNQPTLQTGTDAFGRIYAK